MRNLLSVSLVVLLVALAGTAASQSPPADRQNVLDAVLKGEFGPPTLGINELPAGSHAVELTLSGFSGLQDFEMTSTRFSSLMQGVTGEELERLQEYFSCYWLTGKSVQWYGTEYAIAYKAIIPKPPIEPILMHAAGSDIVPSTNPFAKLTLTLKLINVSQIVVISPLPDLSGENFAKVVMKVNAPNVAHGGNKAAATSSMKQLALAAIMYTGDNDDIYPLAQSIGQARKEVMPYIKNDVIFVSQNPNGGQVLYSVNLAGVPVSATDKADRVPLFYDSRAWPDGGRPVAFCDGHVKYVTAQEWDVVAAELARKYKRAPALPPAKAGAKPKPKN